MTTLRALASDLWFMGYPLKMLGADLRRNVTIIRLSSGKLVIHSTAPFSPEDVAAISGLGEPAWLVDTLLRHDTFSREGHAAFPALPYYAPEGFPALDFPVQSLSRPPAEWSGELEVFAIEGAPSFGEVVFFHPASRTLIVADLLFNFTPHEPLWTRLLLLLASVGGKYNPGITKPFKAAITDRAAYARSLDQILAWDFDRIVVGHGDPIETGGKLLLREAVARAGLV